MTMAPEELSLQALESHLCEDGFPCKRSNERLPFPAFHMEFRARDAKLEPFGDEFASVVTYEARATGAETDGILVLAIGYGATHELAALDAACQWVMGVFSALRSYFEKPEHLCTVETAEFLVAVEDSPEQYGWTAHLPPVLWRAYGDGDDDEELVVDESQQSEVFGAIFNAIHSFAAHRHLFWLECFAARYADGTVDATCRYNNEAWPEGEEALLKWAASWPDTKGRLLSKRQFLLFEPTPVESLAGRDRLTTALSEYRQSLAV